VKSLFPPLPRRAQILPMALLLLSLLFPQAAMAEPARPLEQGAAAERNPEHSGQMPQQESPSASAASSPKQPADASFPGHPASAAGTAYSPALDARSIVQTFAALILLLVLFFAGALALKRSNGGRAFGGNAVMRVLGGIALGTRERVVLLEVGETWLIVGVTPGQMRTLHTMPRGEVPACAAEGQTPFSSWLKQFSERRNEQRY